MRNHQQKLTAILVLVTIGSSHASARPRAPAAFAFDSSEALWLARVASASVTYFGLVGWLDRPKGELNVDPDALQIRQSQVEGAGLGLFCTRPIEKGTILGTYPGVAIPLEQNLNKLSRHPQCEAYVWRFSDNKVVLDPTNSKGDIENVCKGGNPSTFGSTFLFENIPLFGVSTVLCRINEPPLGMSVNVSTEEQLESRRVVFSLLRDVYEGEELFMDYGLSYDRSGYGGPSSA